MKLHDFDTKFFEYARTWIALHPGLKEDEVEERYNELMQSWLNAPASWLDGQKPGEYFNRYDDPRDLIKLMQEYLKRDIGLPEPLYRRIVECGAACAPALARLAGDSDKPEPIRATALAILRDIEPSGQAALYIDLVCRSRAQDALSDMAAEALMEADASVVDALKARYDGVSDYAQLLMLEICANHPDDGWTLNHLVEKLYQRPDERDLYAALLGKLGDPRAIEPLKALLNAADINYLDYIELRNAIECLGGDPGEERCFNGDPDYEALAGM